ncbi:hypothetical protein JHK86_000850 [Glycine max]|nr:hypothetical protein JHK86_000850 [Glycine max]
MFSLGGTCQISQLSRSFSSATSANRIHLSLSGSVYFMSSRKRARTNDIPSSAIPAPQSASIEPDVQHLQTLVPMLQSLFRGQLIIMHSLTNEAAPSEPAPAGVEPMPAEPQNLVVNPPPSPELEVVLPSPPLIIISDASLDEAVAFPNTPVEETTDPPASPIRGIANLSNSSSGEVVALTDSLV